MGGGGNAVVDDLYRDKAVNSGTVGEVTTNIRIVCRGEGLLRGWAQEEGLVAPRGDKEKNSVHLEKSLAGGYEEETTGRESHT